MLYHRIYAANLIEWGGEEERAPRRAGCMRGHRPVGSHRRAPRVLRATWTSEGISRTVR